MFSSDSDNFVGREGNERLEFITRVLGNVLRESIEETEFYPRHSSRHGFTESFLIEHSRDRCSMLLGICTELKFSADWCKNEISEKTTAFVSHFVTRIFASLFGTR